MPAPQESIAQLKARRFGLFVHWGLYALPARHEWVKQREKLTDEHYQRYFERFDPDLYDPAVWAKAAKDAGMTYSVLTSKHHDGFCLFDSALTDYKATNTPYGKDLVRPFVDAFRAEGLGVGFYHSLLDWHHPDYPPDRFHPQIDDAEWRAKAAGRDMAKYRAYLFGQVEELLTKYGEIDVMWFDFSFAERPPAYGFPGKGRDDWASEDLVRLVRRLQPQILINNRLDYPAEADFVTPEQVQPRSNPVVAGREVPWEACQTLNGSWGYDRDNLDWKSPELLVKMLIDSVSKDGNLLLNIGPTGRGEFDDRALATLREIGEWTRRHGRSIYGAGRSEFTPGGRPHEGSRPSPAATPADTASLSVVERDLGMPADVRYTQAGDRLYVHVFSWPFRHLHLPGLAGRVAYAQLLHDASEIGFTEHTGRRSQPGAGENTAVRDIPEGTLSLRLPVQRPDVMVPVIELFLNGEQTRS